MAKFVIGIDYGTESGRAVLVDVKTGREIATAVLNYPDGVIDEKLPRSNIKLPPDWALQNPADYIEVLKVTVPKILKQAKANADNVIGIGVDFTSCTMMPVDADGTPLCMLKTYKKNPHAWVKLWKHHAGQPEADKLNEIAKKRKERFLARYGGKYSSEWLFSKIWQILDEAPDIYNAADKFIEGTDWIVWQMTGVDKRNLCTAGYKALWSKREGYPSRKFFKALDQRLENVVEEKLATEYYPLGGCAGGLTEKFAKMMHLNPDTPVAIANVDAHVAVPACSVTDSGKLVMVMGTSVCHMVLGTQERIVEGMCGVVEDGIVAGYYGFEAGQCGVGDIYAWFVENCIPEAYEKEARKRKIDIHALLEEKASKLKPGQSGLLALDWWNGNRSILVNTNLTGLLLGATLATKPEDIYRALIEATAFGTNKIIKSFIDSGVDIKEIYACGGLPEKNKLVMQVFSDVTRMEIKLSAFANTPAVGSAMHGAVAAGKANGGYDSIQEAAAHMAKLKKHTFKPNADNHKIYQELFKEYETLHDYFGRGANDVMKRLKNLKGKVSGNS